jgi:hypothetical protein
LSGSSTVGELNCRRLNCRGAQLSGSSIVGELNCRRAQLSEAQLSGLNCRGSIVGGSTVGVPYLPYTSDHPHRYHRNIPYSALIRTARACSHVHDFNIEHLRIELSLLLGQYPPIIISNQFLRFCQLNNAMPVLEQLNEEVYKRLHQQLINRTTQRENKLKELMKDPVKYPAILQQKPWDRKMMYPRYLFESGPMSTFPYEFYSWWREHYQYP